MAKRFHIAGPGALDILWRDSTLEEAPVANSRKKGIVMIPSRIVIAAAWALLFLTEGAYAPAAPPTLDVENLGQPLSKRGASVHFVTREQSGRNRAWVVVEAPGRRDVIGIDCQTGKTTVLEFYKYGHTHTKLHRAESGDLYIYSGRPGRFFRYYVEEDRLVELGVPADPAYYWLGQTVGPDGKFYVGAYPQANLVCVDPKTDKVYDLGRMSDDKRNKYLLHPIASDNNTIYCPVGLHHKELWAYDAKTGKSRSILPPEMMKERGVPKIWLMQDGNVYGTIGNTKFRCYPDRVEVVESYPSTRKDKPDRSIGEEVVLAVNENSRLRIENPKTGDKRYLDTDFQPVTTKIYCVAEEYGGKIWGGGFEPADTFTYDPATGKTEDVGHTVSARIQVYDILGHERGLFFSSYVAATQDFFDPTKPVEKGKNPKRIGHFSSKYNQERGQQLCLGPDGMIYTGTVPVKGHLGGAIIRIDPEKLTAQVYEEPVPDLSCHGVISLPGLNGLFVTASIHGGSSAIPKAKEACVFLWDVAEQKVKWTARPIAGAATYARAALLSDGTVFGVVPPNQYYVFDPATRRTLATGKLPVSRLKFPYMLDNTLRGKAWSVGQEGLVAYDPATKRVELVATHDLLGNCQGFCLSDDGYLYFGVGDTLYRAQVP